MHGWCNVKQWMKTTSNHVEKDISGRVSIPVPLLYYYQMFKLLAKDHHATATLFLFHHPKNKNNI